MQPRVSRTSSGALLEPPAAPVALAGDSPADLIRCGYCERLVAPGAATRYADGLIVCDLCRARERGRYADLTGACPRCVYALAWHEGDRCPTEAEARERSGAQ